MLSAGEAERGDAPALRQQLKESLDQQRAVAEILDVIGRSTNDIQPVLDAVASVAVRLTGADSSVIFRAEGPDLVAVAGHAPILAKVGQSAIPIDQTHPMSRSFRERRTVHVPDIRRTDEVPTWSVRPPLTRLFVPILTKSGPFGVFTVAHRDVHPFTPREIALMETFASQAAIAIENVRLFNETKEALERQTATSDVLRVISRSAFDLRPVFDAVLENAARLSGTTRGGIYLRVGDELRAVAHVGLPPGRAEYLDAHPVKISADNVVGRAFLGREILHVEDLSKEADLVEVSPPRTGLLVPMPREGPPIGVIALTRSEVRPFSPSEIALASTFADQAAIAIENVRLFNETKESLERQTATADILRVIAESPTEVQPVLDAIAESAARVIGATDAHVYRVDGDVLLQWAHVGPIPGLAPGESLPRDRTSVIGRAIVDQRPIHIHDAATELDPAEYPASVALQKRWGWRTGLSVPLVRQGVSIGGIAIRRMEVRPFSEKQIELLQTFAQQAVIAIENARLFNETKEALERQTATGQVLEVISRATFDLAPVLETVIDRAVELSVADHGCMILAEGNDYRFAAYRGTSPSLQDRVGRMGFRPKPRTLSAIQRLETTHIEDVTVTDPASVSGRPSIEEQANTKTELTVPLVKEAKGIGALILMRERAALFAPRQVEIVETFAKQAAIAIENARLLNEIQEKSRQLEVASRHKSEFLANMSHELRTPLNAIIGFTDVMIQEMFGPVNEKQKEYLEDVRASGTHLLTLINDILDLSKIEAGRVDLEPTEFSLASAIDNALTLVRERAARHGITVAAEVAPEVGQIVADERKVKQILVNLLSNAVKFTHEGGWVGITARGEGDRIEVAVRDTGIGIAPEDQDRVFEEFQQVGKDPDRSREGTGLGLTLAKRFVELHGGRIWVESDVGKGSTFTFSIPVRQTAAARG